MYGVKKEDIFVAVVTGHFGDLREKLPTRTLFHVLEDNGYLKVDGDDVTVLAKFRIGNDIYEQGAHGYHSDFMFDLGGWD
jgi:hypothetical protein